MEGHPPPTDFDMIKTVAISKIIMGPSMNIQVPPNLNSKTYMLHICSGVNDLGGVSPITIDYVNPECPWPQIDLMTKDISEFKDRRLEEVCPTTFNKDLSFLKVVIDVAIFDFSTPSPSP